MSSPALRQLPSVDRLLRDERVQRLLEREPRALVVQAVREALEAARAHLASGPANGLGDLPLEVEARLAELASLPLRPVINATGVIIHTNLGRAPLSADALAAVRDASQGYANLEYDLNTGQRGSRHHLVSNLLTRLTGAEDALVVNNNAAAVLLALSALAQGWEAVISRGQLVEVGGGFRIPDVMRQSGVVLVEVGTTNRTYVEDYERAVTDRTALFLRVHSSNFLQVGFTHEPTLAELVAAAERANLPVVDDLGSGSLLDTSAYGLVKEPMVQESVAAGAGLVCFSGDKLLGGPQAGILVGRAALVAQLRQHPITRAVRPDKMAFAALGATLLHYLRGEAPERVPVWRMIATPIEKIEHRGGDIARAVGSSATVVASAAAVGGGSLPGQTLPSRALSLESGAPQRLAAALRRAQTPVIARIEDGRVLLDLRTVLPEQDETLIQSIRQAVASHATAPHL